MTEGTLTGWLICDECGNYYRDAVRDWPPLPDGRILPTYTPGDYCPAHPCPGALRVERT